MYNRTIKCSIAVKGQRLRHQLQTWYVNLAKSDKFLEVLEVKRSNNIKVKRFQHANGVLNLERGLHIMSANRAVHLVNGSRHLSSRK